MNKIRKYPDICFNLYWSKWNNPKWNWSHWPRGVFGIYAQTLLKAVYTATYTRQTIAILHIYKIRYCTFEWANNKCAEQTARMHRLVCAFVVRIQQNQGSFDSAQLCDQQQKYCSRRMLIWNTSFSPTLDYWERSGSVVECLTRDSSLTGGTALWSLSKTHLS